MLNSCRKFIWIKICYWKFEGNLNTHVPLWAKQHMVDRHYSLNLKPWSARTLYVYRFSTKILRWSAGNFCLQVVLEGRKLFIPALLLTLSYCNSCKPAGEGQSKVLLFWWEIILFCMTKQMCSKTRVSRVVVVCLLLFEVCLQTVFLPRPSNLSCALPTYVPTSQ
jgi:hypothetical protein